MSNESKTHPGMERVAAWIVQQRRLLLILVVAALVFCAFSSGWVEVDNELSSFLSEEAEARRGLEIMADEFVTYGTAEVMVEDVTPEQAQSLAETLAALDGVAMVDYDGADAHYRDGAALYSVTFDAAQSDPACETALDGVRSALADYTVSVSSEIGSSLQSIVSSEMQVIVVVVAIVVVGVLIFTSQTYAEVLVLILTFLAAALLNQGTNFLLGKISFVSNSVAIVLQLALSIDYAVIFCNRYKEEHAQLPIREAVVKALACSIPEICSSSLTTIAGLTAMTFMQFRLGADLGLVLIKAIVCSLLSVFVLMPALLMIFGKWMDKTRHKNFVPKIPFIGRFAHKTRKVIPLVFLVVFCGAFLLFRQCNFAYSEAYLHVTKQNEQQLATQAITERFGSKNILAVLVPVGDYASEAALLDELAACDEVESAVGLAGIEAVDGCRLGDKVNCAAFASLAGVDDTMAQALFAYYGAEHGDYTAVTDDLKNYEVPLVDLFLFLHDKAAALDVPLEPEQLDRINALYDQLHMAQQQLQGANYSRLVLTLNLPVEGEEAFPFIDRVHVIAAQYYDDSQVVTTGTLTNAYDFSKCFERDNMIVSLMSLLLVMAILLFTFRSFGMPLLLILVIQGSIWINFAITKLTGSYVFFMCYLIVSAVQMGANIDYAIVISSRYTELRKALPAREAMIETMNLAFPTVITSGTMMVVSGLLIGYMVSEPVISGIGLYVGSGTIITLILVMFVLPQILLFGEGFVNATALKARRRLHVSRETLRKAGCGVLTAVSVFALAAAPLGLKTVSDLRAEQTARAERLQADAAELAALAAALGAQQEVYDAAKLSFAEHAVTDSVGQEQLSAGQAEYDAGAAQLAAGQAEYDAAAARLAAGKEQYAAGQEQLADAKVQYAAGQEKLNRVQPVYDLVYPLYANYQSLQQQYDAAVANGDTVQAMLLKPRVDAQRAAFETQLAGTGHSIESLIQEYEAGQAELAAGAAQIADAEQQLDDAAAQIADGERQLAAAKQQLDAGYAELDTAGGALAAGRETLAENHEKLSEDLQSLSSYSDEQTRLEAGVQLLMQQPDIASRAGTGATYAEVCTAAQAFFAEDAAAAQRECTQRTVFYALLLAAAAFGLCAGLLGLAGKGARPAAVFSAVAALLALAVTLGAKTAYTRVLANGSGAGTLQFVAALLLTLAALAAAELLHRGAAAKEIAQ